jgi:flagellar M-ring protein FliF
MDFLNKAYAQIADLFRSMTPGARITAGLLLVVVVVSVGYLFNTQMSGPACDLLHGQRFPDSQLDLMMSAFGKANLNDAVRQNGQIFVPHGMEPKYMAALGDAGALPPTSGSAIKGALAGNNILTDPVDRNNRWIAAKQEEMKNAISKMAGISDASVMIDSTITPGLKREKLITASVCVTPNGSQEIDEETAAKIRNYVAFCVAGLKKENVLVTDQIGHSFSGDPENGGAAGDSKYVGLKNRFEKDLINKIKKSLSNIPGVTVAVSVKLDTNETTRTTEIKHDKTNTVDVHVMDSSTTRNSDTSGTGGQAGLAAQQPNVAMSLANKPIGGSKEEETGSKTETQSVPSGKQTDTVKIGLTPIMETASIGIPVSYFKKIWQAKNPPAAGQEPKEPDAAALEPIRTETIAKVKKQVAKLLTPPEGNTDPTELVEVTDFPEIPVVMPPEPSLAKNAMLWLGDYWSVAGMLGLAGVSLLMLRSLVKAGPPVEPSSSPRLADLPEEEDEEVPNKPPPARVRRFTAGPSLRDEISVLVKEDPDTAANILKTWIGHAG